MISYTDRQKEQGGGSNLTYVLGKSVNERVVVQFRKTYHGGTENREIGSSGDRKVKGVRIAR